LPCSYATSPLPLAEIDLGSGGPAAPSTAAFFGSCWNGGPQRSSAPFQLQDIAYGHSFFTPRVIVQGLLRQYTLYVPRSPGAADGPMPILVLCHPHDFDVLKMGHKNWDAIIKLASREKFMVVMFIGVHRAFDVWVGLRALPGKPDEVAYAEAVLQDISLRYCIDQNKMFCTGLSNGGRLCGRFASEMPVFSAMAIISAIRYPVPNHRPRTKPLRLISFHGTADPINPYWGGVKAPYWGPASVVQVTEQWAEFNGCTKTSGTQLSPGISYTNHSGCKENADVVLVSVRDGSHMWPFLSDRYSTFKCGDADIVGEQWWDVTSLDTAWAVWKFLFHGELSISRKPLDQDPLPNYGDEFPSWHNRGVTAMSSSLSGNLAVNVSQLPKDRPLDGAAAGLPLERPLDAAIADLALATGVLRISVFGVAILMAALALATLCCSYLSRMRGDDSLLEGPQYSTGQKL